MAYQLRRPEFKVVILRPNYSQSGAYSEKIIAVFDSSSAGQGILSYSYRQDLASFDSQFLMTFTVDVVGDTGTTILELTRNLDIVKIEEYGKLKYMGVIKNRRYAAMMAEGGPDRSIVISGLGVGGILGRFEMLLDQIILADAKTVVTAMNNNLRALVSELSGVHGENSSMTAIFEKIAEAFKEAMQKVGGYTPGTGIYKVVDQYLKFSRDSAKLNTKYPMALSVFTYGGNTLLGIWNSLVFKPFYEFFIRWDEASSSYLIHLRPTPFDPEAWSALKMREIDPLHITAVDLGFSDDDVKTWFFAYLTGGSLSYENARYNAQSTAIEKDKTKWALYGYRPLECAFKYVDHEKLAENGGNIQGAGSAVKGDVSVTGLVSDEKLMSEYSKKLYAWYRYADEMATGSITAMTVADGPTIGERAVVNGAEFYVEAVDGSWSYGAEMQSKYSVTRGGVYNKSFNAAAPESSANWWFRTPHELTLKMTRREALR